MTENLTNENFLLYAAKYYISPHYIEQEFFSDLKKVKYIKRLLQRYRYSGDLKERLILNHIISFYNVFEPYHCTKMLFLKVNQTDYPALKTFLVYLNYMPERVGMVNDTHIISSDIQIDFAVANKLRNL